MSPLERWELLVRKKMEPKKPPKVSWLLDDPRNINNNYLFIV
jgi:hypothetical protein